MIKSSLFRFCNLFLLIVILFSTLISGCDHTELTGEIIIPERDIKVGDSIPLILKVPENLSEIYRVMWTVEPKEIGEIVEGDELFEELSTKELKILFNQLDEINPDRIALFKAKETGSAEIFVAGFYRQTNPQGITAIDIEVVE